MSQEPKNSDELDSMKYLLHHKQNNHWVVVSSIGLETEMRLGLYDQCKGPYDDAKVDVAKEHKAENEKIVRTRHVMPRVRSQEEIMEQVTQVRAKYCGIRV